MKRSAVAIVAAIILSSCATAQRVTSTRPTATVNTRNLSVVLFPWIPDANKDNFTALKQYLVSQFQAEHPDVVLMVTMDPNLDTYSSTVQSQLFQSNGPNVVELDTVSLADLVGNGFVAPLTYAQPSAFTFASTAVQYKSATYGIPTWVCMNFWYGRPSPASSTVQQTAGSAGYSAMKSGIWDGSWTLPTLYLQAYVQLHGYVPLGPVMTQAPDPNVLNGMTAIFTGCNLNAANNCLNSTFKTGTPGMPQQQYANGTYEMTTGFSESLFYILAAGGPHANVIQPMLVAAGTASFNPLAFTDALVVNQSSCLGQCVTDAYTFAQFLNSPQTRLYICYSGDAHGNAPPRYLSPASQSFYEQSQVANDPNYRSFSLAFSDAQPFPNEGLPESRKTLNVQLCTALKATIPDTCNAP